MPVKERNPASAPRAAPSLADRYGLEEGRVFMSRIQALVRLPIEQMRRDRRAGLRTRAFITGYPGSPLGGFDIALQQAGAVLDKYGVHHLPGQNEELGGDHTPGGDMIRNPQLVMPVDGMVETIRAATGWTDSVVLDARRIAELYKSGLRFPRPCRAGAGI